MNQYQNMSEIPRENRNWAFWLATGLGFGLLKPAPGTWGSLLGLALGILIIEFSHADSIEMLAWIFAASIIGIKAIGYFIGFLKDEDAPEIVIDEIAGQWIAMLPIIGAATIGNYIGAFLLFRLFDILKPWPISLLERKIKGPIGVMADDWLAGVFAAIVLFGINNYFHLLGLV